MVRIQRGVVVFATMLVWIGGVVIFATILVLRIWELMGADPPRKRPQIDKIIQIGGFEAWDPSHEKERAKICRKLESRASETVWASSYGQITDLESNLLIFASGVCW